MMIIRNGRVLDPATGEAPQRDILIRDGKIAEIGAPGLAAPEGAELLDARNRLIHPGLVNAHTHAHGNLAKGMGDRWTLELLLVAAPWISGNFGVEEKYLTALVGGAEMALKGVTACYDLFVEFPVPSLEGMDAIGRAYEEVGIRSVVAPMVADHTVYEAIPGLMDALPPALQASVARLKLAPGETTLAALRKILSGWQRKSARIAVAPTIPHHCSEALLKGCRALATEYGTLLHTHIQESKVQAVTGIRKYGMTLTAYYEAMGMLGPDFTAAHGVWMDEDDMRRLAAHGCSVAHNPGSNMRLGNGIADARRMIELGVNVGIGTDGAGCSDNQNVFEAMRTASYGSKSRGPDPAEWLTTRQIFHAATVGGSRAMAIANGGQIAVGAPADLVLLDLEHPNWIPVNDPLNQLVHAEDGNAVDTVLVAGKVIVRNRRLVGVDVAKMAAKVAEAKERLNRLNADNKTLVDKLMPVVNSYCVGLARTPYHVNRYAGSTPF